MNLSRLHAFIDSLSLVTKYGKAVLGYADELLTTWENDIEELTTEMIDDGILLNGASDWKEFSYSGCSLCYDDQIADAFGVDANDYSGNELLDMQAEALEDAEKLIKIIISILNPEE